MSRAKHRPKTAAKAEGVEKAIAKWHDMRHSGVGRRQLHEPSLGGRREANEEPEETETTLIESGQSRRPVPHGSFNSGRLRSVFGDGNNRQLM